MTTITLKYLDRTDSFFPGYYLKDMTELPLFIHLTQGLFAQWIGNDVQVAQLEQIAAMHSVTVIKIHPQALERS
jgi:hypothetical protein